MILSVVTTLYQSEAAVCEFYARASRSARELVGNDYEIVMVNDGSTDKSLAEAIALAERDPHLVVIDLSRNFGHHKAMMSGISKSRGDFVFLIDSDLEEEPELLSQFSEQMSAARCDVVYGVQKKRKGDWFEQVSGDAFYRVYELLTGFRLPRNLLTVRLMTRRYVDALLEHREREMFIAGLWLLTGFDQQPIIVNKKSLSQTTYSLRRKLSLLVTSVTSMSNRPLVVVFYVGLSVFLMAFAYTGMMIARWLLVSRPPDGWTSLIASVWMLGGLTVCSIGLVGIYVAKVFTEVKQRPYALVRSIFNSDSKGMPNFDLVRKDSRSAGRTKAASAVSKEQ
jgi:putative glycosyltransferase